MYRIILSMALLACFIAIAKNSEAQTGRSGAVSSIEKVNGILRGNNNGSHQGLGATNSGNSMDNDLYSVQGGGTQSGAKGESQPAGTFSEVNGVIQIGGTQSNVAADQNDQDKNGLQDGGTQTDVKQEAQAGGTLSGVKTDTQHNGAPSAIGGDNGGQLGGEAGNNHSGGGNVGINLNSDVGDSGKDDIVGFGSKVDQKLGGGGKEGGSSEGGAQPGGTTTTIGHENTDEDKQTGEVQGGKQDNTETQTEVGKDDTGNDDNGGGNDEGKPNPDDTGGMPNPDDPYDHQERKPEEVMKGASKTYINPGWGQKGKAAAQHSGSPADSKMMKDPNWIMKNKGALSTPASMKGKGPRSLGH